MDLHPYVSYSIGLSTAYDVRSTGFGSDMKTRDDAVKAIRELMIQFREHPDNWENPTLESFLEALAAWLEDSGRSTDHPPSWGLIIQMLEAAKIYE